MAVYVEQLKDDDSPFPDSDREVSDLIIRRSARWAEDILILHFTQDPVEEGGHNSGVTYKVNEAELLKAIRQAKNRRY